MMRCGFRSVSLPFRYIHRNHLSIQRFRPFTMGSAEVLRVNTTQRLRVLRELMAQEKYDVNALIVPSEDQHSSEYLANCDKRRAFISGFDGSAGCAVVTKEHAYLFTDGRYFLQAEQQLDDNWTLMKQGLRDVPTWQEFVSKRLETESRVGIDPTLIPASDAESVKKSLKGRQSELVSLSENLVDIVWGTDRPARSLNHVFPLPIKFTGQSHEDKLAVVRKELESKKLVATVVNALDDVAWLFNLRGSDIDYNPVFFAYAVVTAESAILFAHESQIDDIVREHLGPTVKIQPYESFFPYLRELSSGFEKSSKPRVLISKQASLAIADAIGKDFAEIELSIVTNLKSIKNDVEISGFRECHVRDGAALVRYFAWLEEQLHNGAVLSESGAADQLEKYRSELKHFKGLSFDTISSTGPNAAIIHYKPSLTDSAIIKRDQIYLCDSGAQFLDGTTDVTRTWHFGTPTPEEKRAFTRVLQGHIAIDTAVFPRETTGFMLDSWARRPLWKDGLDYRHGTGHGVGSFLNVHEGPQGISFRITSNTPLRAGMTLSNEPGYYEDGKYGIRIESIVIIREAETPNNFGQKGYLRFENVTMCPIHKNLIDVSLLEASEKAWVDSYHQEVYEKLLPLLANDLRATEWLKRETSPL
ncbi:Creatinase/aminopeptidase [Thelephora terrestris]|uniref:Creatinase/aminopeptidase n=1 Tax=Thelephora terrestris TaxID=56493 RepID=A0A9P6HKG4_9AGAM|nr:Creatinase/aminopeptidase [Thelephora terrestris]